MSRVSHPFSITNGHSNSAVFYKKETSYEPNSTHNQFRKISPLTAAQEKYQLSKGQRVTSTANLNRIKGDIEIKQAV